MKFSDLANLLIEKKEINIATGDRKTHDNLRIRLCKYFSFHKKLMSDLGADSDDTTFSMCGTFDSISGRSSFTIRIRTQSRKDYEIVEIING